MTACPMCSHLPDGLPDVGWEPKGPGPQAPLESAGPGEQQPRVQSCRLTVMGPCRERVDHQSRTRSVLARPSSTGHSACLDTACLLGLSPPSCSALCLCSRDTLGLTFNQSLGQGISHSVYNTSWILYYSVSIILFHTMHIV